MFCDNLSFMFNMRNFKEYRTSKGIKLSNDKWKPLPLKEQYLRWNPNIIINGKRGGYVVVSHKKQEQIISDKWSRVLPFSMLLKRFDETTIKQFIIKRFIVLIPCGKCEKCIASRRNKINRRVKSQMFKSKYNYLLTITHSNDNIRILANNETKKEMLENDDDVISYLSMVSKIDSANIIKNIKNKLNRFYKQKVKVHYLLCGEYGENTKRAHYHILLMLEKPLPNLIPIPSLGNHYKCSIFESKQFGLYDLQLADNKTNTSKYITKYLTKESSKHNTLKLNQFQERQLYTQIKNNNLGSSYLYKKQEHIDLINEDEKNHLAFIIDNKQVCSAFTYQKEFIKSSRCLGLSNNYLDDFEAGLLNKYYVSKIKIILMWWLQRWLGLLKFNTKKRRINEFVINYYLSFVVLYIWLLKAIEKQREVNIMLYGYRGFSERRKINKCVKEDIF